MMGERRRALEDSEYVRGGQGSLERYGGLPRVVLLTPEGGQLINIGIGRGFVFSVISQKTAEWSSRPNFLPVSFTFITSGASQQASEARCGSRTGWPAGTRDGALHYGLPPG